MKTSMKKNDTDSTKKNDHNLSEDDDEKKVSISKEAKDKSKDQDLIEEEYTEEDSELVEEYKDDITRGVFKWLKDKVSKETMTKMYEESEKVILDAKKPIWARDLLLMNSKNQTKEDYSEFSKERKMVQKMESQSVIKSATRDKDRMTAILHMVDEKHLTMGLEELRLEIPVSDLLKRQVVMMIMQQSPTMTEVPDADSIMKMMDLLPLSITLKSPKTLLQIANFQDIRVSISSSFRANLWQKLWLILNDEEYTDDEKKLAMCWGIRFAYSVQDQLKRGYLFYMEDMFNLNATLIPASLKSVKPLSEIAKRSLTLLIESFFGEATLRVRNNMQSFYQKHLKFAMSREVPFLNVFLLKPSCSFIDNFDCIFVPRLLNAFKVVRSSKLFNKEFIPIPYE